MYNFENINLTQFYPIIIPVVLITIFVLFYVFVGRPFNAFKKKLDKLATQLNSKEKFIAKIMSNVNDSKNQLAASILNAMLQKNLSETVTSFHNQYFSSNQSNITPNLFKYDVSHLIVLVNAIPDLSTDEIIEARSIVMQKIADYDNLIKDYNDMADELNLLRKSNSLYADFNGTKLRDNLNYFNYDIDWTS